MLRSQGINANHGLAPWSTACVVSYKQLITFGIPQCSPAGKAKQILVEFWQVMHKAKIEKQKPCVLQTCKNIKCLSTQAAVSRQNHRLYISTCDVSGKADLSLRALQFEDIYFSNICWFYNLTKLTMSVIQ